MRSTPTTRRPSSGPPNRPLRPSRARSAGACATPGPFDAWIEAVGALLNSPNAAERERGLDEIERGFAFDPGAPTQDRREMLAAVARAADKTSFGNQPEVHIALAIIQLRRFGDRAGAERSLWLAAFAANRLAASNHPVHRARASETNRRAARLWGDLGNSYQREARNAIGRYLTSSPAHRAIGAPVRRQWPNIGRDETSSDRQPTMGPREETVPVPPLLRIPNGSPSEPVPASMEGPVAPILLPIELLHYVASLWGVYRRGRELSTYLRACDAARRNRDFLPTPMKPAAVRELAEALRSALDDPRLSDEQRLAARRLAESVDLGYLEEASLAYWGTPRP